MDNYRAKSVPQKVQYLASQKIKARLIRQSMIIDNKDFKQQNVAKNVIKYQTFLSHQMLSNIKTQELRSFQSEVKQICQKQKSMESCRTEAGHLGISKFLEEIKKQAKLKITRDKHQIKTQEQSKKKIYFPINCLINREKDKIKDQQTANFKLKLALSLKKKRQWQENNLKLKGTVMKKSLLDLMYNLEQTNIAKPSEKQLISLSDNSENDILPSRKLKQQKQRLTTVLQNHGNLEFKPIGNVRKIMKNKRYNHFSQKKSITQMPQISKPNLSRKNIQIEVSEFNNESQKLLDNLCIFPIHKKHQQRKELKSILSNQKHEQ